MSERPEPIRGRGTRSDPPNRFEPIEVDLDPDGFAPDDERPDPRTRYFRDTSRSALAYNQSPDVPFDASLNPYRGCEHGCVYCLEPNAPVLYADMSWRPLGEVRLGDVLVGFDERPPPGGPRKLRPAIVEAVWWSRKPTLRLVTERCEVIASASHRWLQARDFRWSRTEQLSDGRLLRRLPLVIPEPEDDDYRAGYIGGLSVGDGTLRFEPGQRSDKLGFPQAYWRIALVDRDPLERTVDFLSCLGINAAIRPFSPAVRTSRPMWKVEVRSLALLERVSKILTVERASGSYRRGFLAGFFDAEGHNGTSLRVSQVDLDVLERVRRYAASVGFHFHLERRPGAASTLRLVGSLGERLRFFSACRPALRRKIDRLFGRKPPTEPERVVAVERGSRRDLVDIQTSTGTFFAAGLATHNCYARPTHEYLGLSAGLDFETKIFVKSDAPRLLRAELASPSWKPQVIALSGVTDPYQPVERRLGLTRACLEVLAEVRNPVGIVTKSRLVERDADVLQELARHQAVSAALSITTLDPELARVLEPRAAQPRARLAAIEALARAGVPVGVNVAPVIPGLNDHEIPAIVAAAAGAGARWAAWILVRLPHGVEQLFERWLEDHRPERKGKVLARIRDTRGGALSDPRFGSRMRGEGLYAAQIRDLVELARRRAGMPQRGPELSCGAFRRPGGTQLPLL